MRTDFSNPNVRFDRSNLHRSLVDGGQQPRKLGVAILRQFNLLERVEVSEVTLLLHFLGESHPIPFRNLCKRDFELPISLL